MTEDYQIVFQAQTTFQRVYVNIAIDDIQVSSASQCQAVTTPPTTVIPTTTPASVSALDCTFEKDFCSWNIDRSTGRSWLTQRWSYLLIHWKFSIILMCY